MDNRSFERRFLLDYMWFGRMVLAHQARVLNDAHAAEADSDRRRAYFISIHTILIQQCEHVGAWLLAFRRWADSGTFLVETLARYNPGEGRLEDRLRGIANGHDLLRSSGIDHSRLVPSVIPEDRFEERVHDIWEGLSYFAQQQSDRAQLYNKSKHGMLFLSSPRAINPELEELGPLAIYSKDRRADPVQISYVGLDYSPEQPRILANQTNGLAHALGDVILFYMMQEHPDAMADIDRILRSKDSMLMLP